MNSLSVIGKAVGAVLIAGWAVWTELRLRQAQNQILADKLQIKDDAIEKATDSLSNLELATDLSKELSGNSPTKPKA